jgi:hypothetical protein
MSLPTSDGFRSRNVAGVLLAFAWGVAAASAAPPAKLQARLKEMQFRVQTAHYVLLADVQAVQLKRYGEALEAMYKEYEAGFERLLEQRKTKSELFTVAFFAVKSDYDQFSKEQLGGGAESSIGMFVPNADLLLILDQGSFTETCGIVFHEAFHQFMHRYIKDPPTWLNEGLATFYGCARLTSEGVSFSKPPAERWELTRKLIAQRKFMPLAELVSFSQAEFYRQDKVQLAGYSELTRQAVCYAEAYTLVHLLLSDDGGRERVQAYIAALAEEKDKKYEAVTREFFGPDTCDYLTGPWIKHVNSRPEQK